MGPPPTSLVVLPVGAERLGGNVAPQPSPPGLADAVPDVLIEDAPPVVVAQPGAAVCQHITQASNSRASQHREIRVWGGLGRGILSGQGAEGGGQNDSKDGIE